MLGQVSFKMWSNIFREAFRCAGSLEVFMYKPWLPWGHPATRKLQTCGAGPGRHSAGQSQQSPALEAPQAQYRQKSEEASRRCYYSPFWATSGGRNLPSWGPRHPEARQGVPAVPHQNSSTTVVNERNKMVFVLHYYGWPGLLAKTDIWSMLANKVMAGSDFIESNLKRNVVNLKEN